MVAGKRVERGEEPRPVVETGGETVSLALQPRVADDGGVADRSVEPRMLVEPNATPGSPDPRLCRAVDRVFAAGHLSELARRRSALGRGGHRRPRCSRPPAGMVWS